MKKFYVVHTRPCLFPTRKNGYKEVSTFINAFDHAVNAYKYACELRAHNAIDNRWPILTVEVLFQRETPGD